MADEYSVARELRHLALGAEPITPNIGTEQNPFTTAPADWKEHGVPYGAWCRCGKCGLVARSTYAFDYFADAAGDALTCQNCKLGSVQFEPGALRDVQDRSVTDA